MSLGLWRHAVDACHGPLACNEANPLMSLYASAMPFLDCPLSKYTLVMLAVSFDTVDFILLWDSPRINCILSEGLQVSSKLRATGKCLRFRSTLYWCWSSVHLCHAHLLIIACAGSRLYIGFSIQG
uniref:Uncharacterized protein n=1 Tax=Physcomitrium patens TaxID=3218 RepID=A0A7I3ZT63_PHYPA